MNVKRCLFYSTASLVATSLLVSQSAVAQIQRGFFLINELSNKCIDVAGAPGRNNGSPLQLFDCELRGFNANGSFTDQRWEDLPGRFLRNVQSQKCLDVAGAPGRNNGPPLQLFDCELRGFNANGSFTDQRWEFLSGSGGLIRNVLSQKCIDVAGDPGRNNGSRLQLFDCELRGVSNSRNNTDQRWRRE